MNSDYALPLWEQEQEKRMFPDSPTINPKQIRGLWMPEQYLFSKELTIQEKILMSFIYTLDQKDHCYASNRYLGELIKTSAKTVSNMLISLKKKGFVEQLSWDGNIRFMKCLK